MTERGNERSIDHTLCHQHGTFIGIVKAGRHLQHTRHPGEQRLVQGIGGQSQPPILQPVAVSEAFQEGRPGPTVAARRWVER